MPYNNIAGVDDTHAFPPEVRAKLAQADELTATYLALPGGTKTIGKAPVVQSDGTVQWAAVSGSGGVSAADNGLGGISTTSAGAADNGLGGIAA